MVEFVANRLGKVKIYKQFKLVIELKTKKKIKIRQKEIKYMET